MMSLGQSGYERMFSMDFPGCSYIGITFLSLTICTSKKE